MKSRKLYLVIWLATLTSACYYDVIRPADPNAPPQDVSFSGDLQPIFNSSCTTTGCHDGSHEPTLTPDKSYNSLMSGGFVNTIVPDKSILYVELSTGAMPPTGKLAPDDIQKVLDWIKKGAPNN